jgi:Cu/Ag efflux pump CusA
MLVSLVIFVLLYFGEEKVTKVHILYTKIPINTLQA